MNRNFSISLIVGLLLFSCRGKSDKEEKDTKTTKPNIIVIFTDDQGYADLSCYGATAYRTPHIDELASQGVRFTDFYVPATVCTPSRAALLTGSYPKRVGLHESVLRPFSDTGLSPNEYTMAEMLKDVGYQTACVGKWHLGHQPEFMPNNQGFDYFFGVPYSNDMDSFLYREINFQSPPLPLFENEKQIESGPDQRFLTKRFTDATIKYIKDHKDAPFFVYLAHIMPHIPLHVSEEFEGKTSYGLYGDVISELDWNVGRIVSFLKEEGLFENTIIVFTSDNGPHRAVNRGAALPLRGWKTQTWEGGQRVPGIITWPSQIPSKVVSNELVTTMDLMPTLAAITGGKLPLGSSIDGRNLKHFLKNPTSELQEYPLYYYATNGSVEAVRLGKWKLHIAKSIGYDSNKNFPVSLYDLKNDLGEQENVAHRYPEVVSKLNELIIQFDKQLTKEARTVGRIE
ncbi:Arylsulfatase A [Arenibacter nanhaiticus]|uniref:Arylsulfatase A n=1 Tax=Arenibacter nanhaiticus TaxID=558155 RepID=A0A1M6CC39_9FLAO|nr:sulfatase [Arenibacter nanhaiticus]SHI58391.1 Arylsulfatase A [Arenibacter nanhaiticus]